MLTEEEKQAIKYHLGYPIVNEGVALSAGIPISLQPMHLVISALDRVPETAIERVRRVVGVLDKIEHLMTTLGLKALISDQLEELKLRPEYLPDLRREYRHWQSRLSQLIHAPINPDMSGASVDMGVCNVTVC